MPPGSYYRMSLEPNVCSTDKYDTSGNYHRININPVACSIVEALGAPTMSESWDRLEKAKWLKDKELAKILKSNDKSAKYQKLTSGYGENKYDEYSIIIKSFPSSLTTMEYLVEFAKDPNFTIQNTQFTRMNEFKKRKSGSLALGDIWDIDIFGPDNGSIVLVDKSINFGLKNAQYGWFDIQTLTCDENGKHPESGAREFGFLPSSQGIKFYTRGVSRPVDFLLGNPIAAWVGSSAQKSSWTGMMRGILDSIIAKGGKADKTQDPYIFIK